MLRPSESKIKKNFASPRESEFFLIFNPIQRIGIRESKWIDSVQALAIKFSLENYSN